MSFDTVKKAKTSYNERDFSGRFKSKYKEGDKNLAGCILRNVVESDWKEYWSSSDDVKKDVLELGEDSFVREILHICPNKGSCNYLEAREQMDRRVLETEDYYNGTIQCRIHRTHIKECR